MPHIAGCRWPITRECFERKIGQGVEVYNQCIESHRLLIPLSYSYKRHHKHKKVPQEANEAIKSIDREFLSQINYTRPDLHLKPRSFRLSPKNCSSHSRKLIILVFTKPDGFESRGILRQTWGNSAYLESLNSRLIFVTGLTDDPKVTEILSQEFQHNGDILQIDFYDSYYNLTLKTLSALEWVSRHCKTPKFIAKIDDDNIVNIHNLFGGALNVSRLFDRFILGYTYSDFKPVNTTGKRFDPVYEVLYNQSYYPTFISGPGYVLTNNFLEELLQSCRNKPFIHLEDVFVNGICAEDVEGVVKASMPGFYMRKLSACEMKTDGFILSHGFELESRLYAWYNFSKSKPCDKSFHVQIF